MRALLVEDFAPFETHGIKELPDPAPGTGEVVIDTRAMSLNFPDLVTPGLFMEIGSLGLKYLLENRASAYLPRRLVERPLAQERLRLVPGVPAFHYPAYVVYPAAGDAGVIELVLQNLRSAAQQTTQ